MIDTVAQDEDDGHGKKRGGKQARQGSKTSHFQLLSASLSG